MGEVRSFGLPYAPGLDGLRAVAVMVVVAFHLEVPGFDGGFLGVSLFFTLSGFLITQLLVGEHRATGRISLRHFWSRRFRRLMPAALAGIGSIAAVSIVTDLYSGARLRGDLAAALGYAANWRFAFGSRSYSELFAAGASPVQHFWSLAIEEQFYFVFPVVVAALLARRARRALPIALVTMLAVSVVAALLIRSRDLVYYGSHVRAAELLAGALLALVVPVGRSLATRASRVAVVTGAFAVVVFAVLVVTATTMQSWLYDGGLAAFSVVSAALVVAVLVPGPLRAVASWRPLVFVGRISYGLYVFHWPVIVAMSPERVPVSGWLLDLFRVAVTFVLALVSWYLIEQPVRQRRVLVRLRPALVAASGAFVVVAVAVVAVPDRVEPALAGVAAPDSVVAFGAEEPKSIVETQDRVSPSTRDPDLRIVVLGSVANVARRIEVANPETSVLEVSDLSNVDCPLRPGGGTRNGCPSLEDVMSQIREQPSPDVVVVSLGRAERLLIDRLVERRVSADRFEEDNVVVHKFGAIQDYLSEIVAKLSGYPVVFFDVGPRDVLRNETSNIVVSREDLFLLENPTLTEVRVQFEQLVERSAGMDSRDKVMVIGDSTSYGVAEALSRSSGERFDVLWAGGRNCPIVDTLRLRWWPDMEFDVSSCPTFDDWSRLWVEFSPSLLLIVSSIPEQSEQRYEIDGQWRMVGDPEYFERHALVLERIVNLADSTSTRVVFFTSPRIHGGALGDAKFALDSRVDGWNRTIDRLLERWPQVTIVDWASIVAEAEGDDPGGLRRGDGVHMEPDDLRRIVGEKVAPLLGGLIGVPSS